MQVVNKRQEANMGSKKVTHKTMEMKSNHVGVPVTPTMVKHQMAPTGEHAKSHKMMMPKHNK